MPKLSRLTGGTLAARMRELAACSVLAAALLATPRAAAAQPDPYAPKWNPWVEFGGLGGDGDGRGIVEFWSPLMQSSNALFFFDGKFQFIEDNAQEGNAQFGVRKMTPSGWNLGAWLSADVRETSADNTFWQIAGGLEALSVKWDLRLNGYLPVTDPQVSPSLAEIVLKRNNIFMIGGEEVALYGVNGEIGYMLFGSPETKPGTRHEFRIYGGGFWFDHSDAIHEVAGPSARVEWRIDNLIPDWGGSRLTFDAGYSHDEVRDDRWEVGARLRIPLGGTKSYASLSPQARRMQERIERDDDIVTVQSGPEKVFDTLTGVRFDRVAYVNPSITEVSQKAGDNSLLIVNGEVSGPQELQGNQTLQGGKSTILVTGLKSGVTTSFTAPGAKATLNDPGVDANLTLLGSNTHVAGLSIEGAGAGNFANFGIFGGSNKNNVVIEQTRIGSTGHAGILFEDHNSKVSIFDTRVTDAGQEGIVFDDNNRAISISGTAVANTGFNGISFGDGNRDVTLAGTTVTNTDNDGIAFADGNRNVTISDTRVTDASNNGILFFSSNSNVMIAGTRVGGTGGAGIGFFDDNSNVTISGTTVTDTGGTGIFFGSTNTNVTIAHTTVARAAEYGIRFEDDNSNVTIVHTTVTDVEDEDNIGFGNRNSNVTIAHTTVSDNNHVNGIHFEDDNSNITIIHTTVSGVPDDGIRFDDGNSNITIAHVTIFDVDDGIAFFGGNENISITNATIRDTRVDGIFLFSGNENVRIANTTIANAGDDGIEVRLDNKDVTIANTTIRDAQNGLHIFTSGNEVTMNDSTLAGTFVNGILIQNFAANTSLNGTGNTAANATFGGNLCEDNGNAWTGTVVFDGVAITNANCP